MKFLVRSLVLSLAASALVLTGCAGPRHVTKLTRMEQPPAGKALVNFHRPSNYGGGILYAIFDGDGKFICDLPGGSEFQYACDPGKHTFFGWAEHVTVVQADVAANKVYDVMIDLAPGWVRANIKMVAMDKANDRRGRLPEFERREKRVVGLERTAHVEDYEQKNQAKIAEIKKDFLGGIKAERVQLLRPDDCR